MDCLQCPPVRSDGVKGYLGYGFNYRVGFNLSVYGIHQCSLRV